MSFHKGDRVAVKPGSERFEGQTGTVLIDGTRDDRMEIIVVNMDSDPIMRGIYAHELELVSVVDETEISRIATVLIDEGGFPSAESALETARILYKAGCRFHA